MWSGVLIFMKPLGVISEFMLTFSASTVHPIVHGLYHISTQWRPRLAWKVQSDCAYSYWGYSHEQRKHWRSPIAELLAAPDFRSWLQVHIPLEEKFSLILQGASLHRDVTHKFVHEPVKALIRMCSCIGWSGHFLFVECIRASFSCCTSCVGTIYIWTDRPEQTM